MCRPATPARPFWCSRPVLGLALTVAGLCGLSGCGSGQEPSLLSEEQLRDPEVCRSCHATQYAEWAGSMHAYAAEDPVFLAMNRRGQRETDGALGDFCVGCHAPQAVRDGLTSDGLNLDELPRSMKGIGCYFCHSVDDVEGTHNNPLRLADDGVMRGGYRDLMPARVHQTAYSALHDSAAERSSALCGACHDVTLELPTLEEPVALERTFAEWRESVFADHGQPGFLSCGGCHMPTASGKIARQSEKERTLHSHTFAAVDVALSPFPNTGDPELDEAQNRRQREEVQRMLDGTVRGEICVQQVVGSLSRIRVTMENLSAGHSWPSGATHDRRAWVELRAYAADEDEPFYTSGIVPDAEPIYEDSDPDVWLLRDRGLDAQGNEALMFWDIAQLEQGLKLPAKVTNDPAEPEFYQNHVVRWYPRAQDETLPQRPARVTVVVRLRPMGLEILDDLIATGDLEPEIRERMPVFSLLPNRHFADDPEFSALAQSTFEYSPLTLEHPAFLVTQSPQQRLECVGIPATSPVAP